MSTKDKNPLGLANLDEFNKICDQIVNSINKLQNFEFKFNFQETPTPPLEVKGNSYIPSQSKTLNCTLQIPIDEFFEWWNNYDALKSDGKSDLTTSSTKL